MAFSFHLLIKEGPTLIKSTTFTEYGVQYLQLSKHNEIFEINTRAPTVPLTSQYSP